MCVFFIHGVILDQIFLIMSKDKNKIPVLWGGLIFLFIFMKLGFVIVT